MRRDNNATAEQNGSGTTRNRIKQKTIEIYKTQHKKSPTSKKRRKYSYSNMIIQIVNLKIICLQFVVCNVILNGCVIKQKRKKKHKKAYNNYLDIENVFNIKSVSTTVRSIVVTVKINNVSFNLQKIF